MPRGQPQKRGRVSFYENSKKIPDPFFTLRAEEGGRTRSDSSPAASLSGVYQVGYFFFSATVTAVAMFCLFSVL